MKIKQFTVVKLPLKKILEQDCRVTLTDKEQEEYLVEQADSLLFDQILRLRGKYSPHISELILMVAKKNPKQEKQLRTVLDHGFIYNGRRYMRFGKSASQGKAGITAFVSDDIFDELYRITQMDIPVEECVISKYEAQRCLLFSSCTIIKDYIPNIIIIGEYEKVLKDRYVRYVVQKQKEITDKETGKPKQSLSVKWRKVIRISNYPLLTAAAVMKQNLPKRPVRRWDWITPPLEIRSGCPLSKAIPSMYPSGQSYMRWVSANCGISTEHPIRLIP